MSVPLVIIMSAISTKLSAFLFPGLTWKIATENKELFLTFDDGPHPLITPKVLNILDEYNAKATFFCVGENVQKHPEAYAEIISRGHQTGNHTFNHLKGWETSAKEYLDNIRKCNELVPSALFRPPHGRILPGQVRQLKKEGYQVVMWSVLARDYQQNSDKKNLLQKVLAQTKAGSIIVFHDSEKAAENMLYMLPEFLAHFSEKGYAFNVIEQQRT